MDEKGKITILNLPEIAGINWETALKNIPTRELLESIIAEFCEKASREMDSMRFLYSTYFKKYDMESIRNYRIKAHSLKHTAALIGAEKLSDEARDLEFMAREIEAKLSTSGRDRNLSVIININKKLEACNEPFCLHYIEMAQNIAQAFGIDLSDKRQVMEKAELLKYLEKLQRAMADFDIQTMNSIMDKFEDYVFPPEMSKQTARLGEAVLSLDSDKLNDAVSKIINMLS